MAKNKKINFVTLGCSKNRVDSEHLLRQAQAAGYDVVYDSDDISAKVVVINTCGFIADAKEESVETILSFVEAKKRGEIEKIFVMGCLSQRYKEQLTAEIPEVDKFFGANDFVEIINILGSEHRPELEDERYLTTPSHYAYLKISEGCDRRCSYCAIPMIRGKHISVPIEVLVSEATKLAKKGVKELLVVAQDTTYYGIDLYGKRKIAELLQELCKIDGIEWIRLHYAYPSQFPDELIEVMKNEPKICKYIDIPFQHISDNQLKLMRRATTSAQTQAVIDKLRAAMPDIAIRTTLIVGHSGETIEEFEQLKEFVSKNKFERLGVFPYSVEEGTYSALSLEDDVAEDEKQRRAEDIMELQASISFANNERLNGTELKVIIDRIDEEYYVCRSQYDSPEVDQEIMVVIGDSDLRVGDFCQVCIFETSEFDLYAELV